MLEHKIWVFYSNTGGGHQSAARALESALMEVAAQQGCSDSLRLVVDSVVERSHPINKVFVGLYNYLLRHKQSWMKYYYSFLNLTRPDNIAIGYQMIKPFLAQLLANEEPRVIVSVHPMLNHYLARNRRELGLTDRVRLIEIVTDPNGQLWKGWACPDMDLIVVPNDLARDSLVALGVPPERVRILGMPVNPSFLKPAVKTKEAFFKEIGLSPDKLTVCLNAGWAGGGNMARIYGQLQHVRRSFQVLFLCGHNEELYMQIKAQAEHNPVKTAVLPFHECMSDVMSHCDLMVTKAGGLTTFEAIAKRLPLAIDMLTEPMPQERGTIEMLSKQGLCRAVHQAQDIVPIVEDLNPVPDREVQGLPAVHSLNKTAAAYEMAKIILASCHASFDLVCDTVAVQAGGPVFEPVWEGI